MVLHLFIYLLNNLFTYLFYFFFNFYFFFVVDVYRNVTLFPAGAVVGRAGLHIRAACRRTMERVVYTFQRLLNLCNYICLVQDVNFYGVFFLVFFYIITLSYVCVLCFSSLTIVRISRIRFLWKPWRNGECSERPIGMSGFTCDSCGRRTSQKVTILTFSGSAGCTRAAEERTIQLLIGPISHGVNFLRLSIFMPSSNG